MRRWEVEMLRSLKKILNGANGMSDMHGIATRVVESEVGAERMKTETLKLETVASFDCCRGSRRISARFLLREFRKAETLLKVERAKTGNWRDGKYREMPRLRRHDVEQNQGQSSLFALLDDLS